MPRVAAEHGPGSAGLDIDELDGVPERFVRERTSVRAQAAGPDAPADTGSSASDAAEGGSSAGDAADATADGPVCPDAPPIGNDIDCPFGGMICAYGALRCTCSVPHDNHYHWACFGPDAGPGANCPGSVPANGSSCGDAGAPLACRYGNDICFCNVGAGSPNSWTCF